MRTLELPRGASAREWGRIHGESYRGEIQSLAALRAELTVRRGAFRDVAEVLAVADRHVPLVREYDEDLHAELLGIAEGANASPAEVVVVNNYTDLRDIDPAGLHGHLDGPDGDGGCSILYDRERAIVAQTWDMHATAIPYVMMLRVPARGAAPAAWTFTLTGCLGMCGMNAAGVAVAINNLHSRDARVGVIWPALVRAVLGTRDRDEARDLVLDTPLGSGHHYLIADPVSAYGIETSGRAKKVIYAGEPPRYVHTNHCVDAEVGAENRVPDGSTTFERYDRLAAGAAARPVADLADAWARLGDREGYPRSVCTNMATADNPHGVATCGAVAMDLEARRVWAQAGFVHNVAADEMTL